ncbi:MAG TPA: ATP-binding protein [Burkholderiaceae bacterium]|nr:ATP-binding protein [Burkholderiaceae bacterium]
MLALFGCVATGYWLWVLRDHRVQFTNRQIRLQTAALAEHASVVFGAVDASLRGALRDVRESHGVPPNAQRGLRQRVGSNPTLRALRFEDGHGHVLVSSLPDDATIEAPPAPPGPLEAPDHASVRVAGSGTASGTSIGLRIAAVPSDSHGGPTLLRLSRDVADVADSGGEVARVAGFVDNGLIAEFFGRIAVADDARAGLFTPSGVSLGGTLALPGRPAETLRELLARPAGADTELGGLFIAAQRLPGLPMIAVTSRDRRSVFAPWYQYVAGASIATLIGLAALAFIVRRLQHEMQARQQAQAALQRTQRLESIGRLAGGIAHDFNNVLALILGFGDLLSRQLAPGSAAAQHAEQLMRAGERGRRLVARILSLRGGASSPSAATPIDVDALVGEAIDLQMAQMAAGPATIRFERALGAPGATVLGDASVLFEAIHNLCMNAIHALQAMPDGGRIRIETSTLTLASERVLSHGTLTAGEHVRITIADDGPGMSGDVLERLFEPFFTTREAQGGTGLGLAMVRGAVTEMGGAIDVSTVPRRGAAFTLYLPRAAVSAHDDDAALASASTLPRGRGQVVMVVDDEPALVALTEELLAELGYEPAGFCDPALALEVLRKSPDRFDALLIDQVMPGLSGIELARALHALRRATPIVLTTGFGGPDLEQRAHEAGVNVVLQKPLRRGELARQLARLLTAAAA